MKYIVTIFIAFFTLTVFYQGSCYTDDYGNTFCSDGFSAHIDDYGNTSCN